MKKEFSFYEFVGILVPGVIFLYSLHLIIEVAVQKQIIDFDKIGESIIFIIICYGLGHILQAAGNIFELIIWFIYGGVPTQWLSNKNRFGNNLFDEKFNKTVVNKITVTFGENIKDYGKLCYNLLFDKEKTKRIDIFNSNYSLFRGLTVTFLLLIPICIYYFNFKIALIPIILFFISTIRMIRFAKYYATEIFRTFYNQKNV